MGKRVVTKVCQICGTRRVVSKMKIFINSEIEDLKTYQCDLDKIVHKPTTYEKKYLRYN